MNNYTANAFKFAAIVEFGSFTEAMKIVAMAETHYTTYMPPRPLGPICTAATIHIYPDAPNLTW